MIVAVFACLAACNSNTDDAKVESMKSGTDSTQTDITYPYEIINSSKFEMGNPQYGKMILEIWKDWDSGDLSTHKNNFADSAELHFWDGSMVKGSRDTVIVYGQAYRNTLASAVSQVFGVTALRSIDKNEDWALVWGKEIDTDKKGKVDSFYLQETWRFNKDGKTDLLYQFRAAAMPPKQ